MKHNDLITGWRGLSVIFVVIGHYVTYRFHDGANLTSIHELLHARGLSLVLLKNLAFRVASPLGEIGVQFFFVISGYLITTLLADEENRNGNISLVAFYTRRGFRIMPAFYIYLFSIFALRYFDLVRLDNGAFFRSGAYLCNLSGFKCSWWLAHTWSLSVEEQFYIAWPLIFFALGKSFRNIGIAIIFLAMAVASFAVPELTSFAHIAIGSLVALSPSVRQRIHDLSSPVTVILAMSALILLPFIAPWPQLANASRVFIPVATAFVFFSTIQHGKSISKLLLAWPLQKIGLASYSIYLWQQLSTAPLFWGDAETGASALYTSYPWAVIVFLLPAALSYIFIEKPMQRFGRSISDSVTRHNQPDTAPHSLVR